jgi:hypothetical protein
MNTIVIEIPHQLPPKVTAWEDGELLNYLRNKSRRCEGVCWRKVTREDLVSDFGDEEELLKSHPEAIALFDSGETEIIERFNNSVCEYLKLGEDDGEFYWYAEHEFGDNHWYWMGTPEDAKELLLGNGIQRLPRHQDIKTRSALENCLENL